MTDVLDRSVGKREERYEGEPAVTPAPLYDTAAALLRHVRIILFVPAVMAIIMVGFSWTTRQYVATSKITPKSLESNVSALAGMAAQFGLTGAPGSRQNESVDFYADLVKSREVIDSLAVTTFTFTAGRDGGDTLSGTYVALNKIKGKTDFERLVRARRRLEGRINVTVKRASGLVTVQTRAKWGLLAEQMNRRLLDLVNEFNLKRRQTAAGAEREFYDRRMEDVSKQLQDAQAALRVFLERNRSYQGDPALMQEMQNRTRKVDEAQQLYATLLQRLDQARADEIRNTPVITIVEVPEGSRKRNSGMMMSGVLGLVAGLLLAVGIALGLEYASAERNRNLRNRMPPSGVSGAVFLVAFSGGLANPAGPAIHGFHRRLLCPGHNCAGGCAARPRARRLQLPRLLHHARLSPGVQMRAPL
jgi:uncharacterized protein involved in exopolysaccharide biosynthesis